MGYAKFPGRSCVLRSSCYVTVKQKNCTSRYCAAAAAAATSIYAATLRAEDVPQISVDWGQKVGWHSRFEQHAEVFTGELENWHVNTLSKTESMGIRHNYRSKQFLSTKASFFNRVLRNSISHFLVGPSVRPSQSHFKGFLWRFYVSEYWRRNLEEQTTLSKRMFVCLSAWLFLKVPTHAT